MITTINEFKKYIINEARLAPGFFKVSVGFVMSDGEWDVLFNTNNIIEIDTDNKIVNKWAQLTTNVTYIKSGSWRSTAFPYNQLILPENYKLFMDNTVILSAEDTPKFVRKILAKDTQFNTTVKNFDTRASEHGLADSDKVKVIVL